MKKITQMLKNMADLGQKNQPNQQCSPSMMMIREQVTSEYTKLIAEKYYWPRMLSDIKSFLRNATPANQTNELTTIKLI
jgi:hypothetical protein